MDNTVFKYNYSSSENEEAKRIRNKYIPKEESKLEILKTLDRKVQNAGIAQSLILGMIGCMIFGIGICMALEAIAGGILFAAACGVSGLAIMLTAYPVYRYISVKTKNKFAPKILELSDELLMNNK